MVLLGQRPRFAGHATVSDDVVRRSLIHAIMADEPLFTFYGAALTGKKPQQFGAVCPASDVFSFAIMLWEMLFGRRVRTGFPGYPDSMARVWINEGGNEERGAADRSAAEPREVAGGAQGGAQA